MTEYTTPQGWTKLGEEARSSTIAYFCKGWMHCDGTEVLVWRAAEPNGEPVIEAPSEYDVPDNAKYTIEELDDGELMDMKFTEDLTGAVEKAVNIVNSIDTDK